MARHSRNTETATLRGIAGHYNNGGLLDADDDDLASDSWWDENRDGLDSVTVTKTPRFVKD